MLVYSELSIKTSLISNIVIRNINLPGSQFNKAHTQTLIYEGWVIGLKEEWMYTELYRTTGILRCSFAHLVRFRKNQNHWIHSLIIVPAMITWLAFFIVLISVTTKVLRIIYIISRVMRNERSFTDLHNLSISPIDGGLNIKIYNFDSEGV